jgi:hypothetical protein
MKPQSIPEAEALAFARERIAGLRICFDKKANRQFYKAFMKRRVSNLPGDLKTRVELAHRGVEVEQEVVREHIVELHRHGKPVPKLLADYTIELSCSGKAVRRRKPGKRPYEYQLRDLEIYLLARDIVSGFKLKMFRSREKKPTRSRVQRLSACSIVSIALKQAGRGIGMNEDAVVDICKRFRRRANVG